MIRTFASLSRPVARGDTPRPAQHRDRGRVDRGESGARLGRFIRGGEGAPEEAPDPFTAEEVRQLLEAAVRDVPEWHTFFLTLARTGLRIRECLALHRDDVDLRRRTLWVRRTWTRGRLGTPKAGRSRAVDLTPQLVESLRRG